MNVTIYTKDNCSFCTNAKMLLSAKGISYQEYKLGRDFTRESLKDMFPAAKTYPIIIVDGIIIGGFTELKTFFESRIEDNKTLLVEDLDMGEWNGA